jgi:hypothetical protein
MWNGLWWHPSPSRLNKVRNSFIEWFLWGPIFCGHGFWLCVFVLIFSDVLPCTEYPLVGCPQSKFAEVYASEIKYYEDVASAINADDKALSLIKEIFETSVKEPKGKQPQPFMIVDGPSGMGKTQLGFCLDRYIKNLASPNPHVFHHLVLISEFHSLTQPVYRAFESRSVAFMGHVWNECEKPNARTYDALWQSEILFSTVAFLASLFLGKAYPAMTTESLRNLLKTQGIVPVLYVDEVPAKHSSVVPFVRNICRASDIHVIMCGTNASALNFLSTCEDSRATDEVVIWAHLVVRAPSAVLSVINGWLAALPSLGNELYQFLLEQFGTSNPFYSRLACKFFTSNQSITSASQCEILDLLRDNIAQAIIRSKGRSKSFAAFCLYLPTYLSPDAPINAKLCDLKKPKAVQHKLVSKAVTNSFAYLQPPNPNSNVFSVSLNNTSTGSPWQVEGKAYHPKCKFPPVKQETLPFLSLTGTKHVTPFPFATTRMALDQMMVESNIRSLGNPAANKRDGDFGEALCSAAMCVSSHIDGVAGTKLDRFLLELLYQLGTSTVKPQWESHTLSLLKGWDQVLVPFLCVPNEEWPVSLTKVPDTCFGSLERPSDSEMVDFKIIGATVGGKSILVTGEFKNHKSINSQVIDLVLKRASERGGVLHFAFCTGFASYSPQRKTVSQFQGWAEKQKARVLSARVENGVLTLSTLWNTGTIARQKMCVIFIDPDAEAHVGAKRKRDDSEIEIEIEIEETKCSKS